MFLAYRALLHHTLGDIHTPPLANKVSCIKRFESSRMFLTFDALLQNALDNDKEPPLLHSDSDLARLLQQEEWDSQVWKLQSQRHEECAKGRGRGLFQEERMERQEVRAVVRKETGRAMRIISLGGQRKSKDRVMCLSKDRVT